ncbi:SDR family oxidoreductase [Stenotrophomonas sp. MMGLT7]|uniref:SDR family NAD(P)-dependent oxidoreductase n=1 Tax=Stenotrophomonas sp. MMGLT7 TaxID=2901227 RepID=UPI001E525725|nr:SDR family oxidoreductase [Stenotrophomonas sp. MMGLT7]MCD7098098.1 SDR family oxidoreductase [Stenotrophomonas sp. MMGLT7]
MTSRRPVGNPIALITGASSGIGREMACQLAARHCELVLVGRRRAELDQLADRLRTEHGIQVHAIAIDLGNTGAAAQLYDEVQQLGIAIDWLVNNAGVGLYGDHAVLDRTELEKMLQLNVVTVSTLCRLFGADMLVRRSGKILNIASTAAYQPSPYFAAYGASKSFVLNFSEALAKEFEDRGVSVGCLSPGPTATGFFRAVDAQGIATSHFQHRDEPADVARQGIELMLRGGLSKIVGRKNFLRALSTRFAPRSVVANISKRVLAASYKDGPTGGLS